MDELSFLLSVLAASQGSRASIGSWSLSFHLWKEGLGVTVAPVQTWHREMPFPLTQTDLEGPVQDEPPPHPSAGLQCRVGPGPGWCVR